MGGVYLEITMADHGSNPARRKRATVEYRTGRLGLV